MAAKAKAEKISGKAKAGTTCWLCQVEATVYCYRCTANHCGTCPCECAAAVSASVRYWVTGRGPLDSVHVMADVGQPDEAVCGLVNGRDSKGRHYGSFHKVPPRGMARCQMCFAPTLSAEAGWGADATDFYLASTPGAPRPERTLPGSTIRHWKFHQDNCQIEDIRQRTDKCPTPARLMAADADQAWPDVSARLRRLNQGAAVAAERMLAAHGQAARLKGDARADAMRQAQLALDAIYEFEIALASEEAVARAYRPYVQ